MSSNIDENNSVNEASIEVLNSSNWLREHGMAYLIYNYCWSAVYTKLKYKLPVARDVS